MDRYVRAIPREKREDDVAREQQRSKHAIRDGCNNVLAHCGLRNAQVPAQCWYLYFKAMQACCWGSAQWGLRNAPEKVLRTSTAAQLGVRNGKFSH